MKYVVSHVCTVLYHYAVEADSVTDAEQKVTQYERLHTKGLILGTPDDHIIDSAKMNIKLVMVD